MLLDTSIPFWYIFNKVKRDLFRVLIISITFHTIKIFFGQSLPAIPLTLPSILGISISLLLAFKVNQSYDRWWEARKNWGGIVNDSRTLVLQLLAFAGGRTESVKKITYRQIAWCYSLGRSLRGLPAIEGIEPFLTPDELEQIRGHKNVPLGILMLHMEDIRRLLESGQLNSYQQVQLDSTIVRLCDSMGKSERINSTVFPATYRRFIHFFIYLFLIILSLALVETIGYWEIPLLTLVASTFFLIEKTAKHMQDPFRNRPTDTSMTAISRTIEINLRQLLGETAVPEPVKPEGFYLM